ncbi:MAG: UbiX family flavin prenyltransferase [Alphaproteobacteria bacterium]|nr:UbiX family flavin prenyltransferase [Alphaproteobacteria bacterium]
MRLVVGITGASGAIFGLRLLQALQATGAEVHLVLSKWGQRTLEHETGEAVTAAQALAQAHYAPGEMSAAIASGSFRTDGMVIVPCSMRTVAAIAHGYGDNLVHRAAEVTLKERRKLVLVPRETPLSEIHLDNLLRLARLGVVILPPDPAFYNHPKTIADIVDHVVARILDQFGIDAVFARRWDGVMKREDVVALRPKG